MNTMEYLELENLGVFTAYGEQNKSLENGMSSNKYYIEMRAIRCDESTAISKPFKQRENRLCGFTGTPVYV